MPPTLSTNTVNVYKNVAYPTDLAVTVFEVKSTKKRLKADFSAFFFGLSGAEVLVAQSLKGQFKFAFVNTTSGDHMELTLAQIFAKARGIYSTWSISF